MSVHVHNMKQMTLHNTAWPKPLRILVAELIEIKDANSHHGIPPQAMDHLVCIITKEYRNIYSVGSLNPYFP